MLTRRMSWDLSQVRTLAILMLLILNGCGGSLTPKDNLKSYEVFCDGQVVSLIQTNEHSLTGSVPFNHSGAYVALLQEESWMLTWPLANLQDGTPIMPISHHVADFKMTYSPKDEVRRESGFTASELFPAGEANKVLSLGDELNVLENGKATPVENRIKTSNRSGSGRTSDGYILTRSRKYGFSWLPKPVIYSTLNAGVVQTLNETTALNKFRASCRADVCRKVLLTDDLAYLVSLTTDDLPLDGRSPQAVCYSLKRDEVTTVFLTGVNGSMIEDVHSSTEGLTWQVCLNPLNIIQGDGAWGILDSSSQVLYRFTVPARSSLEYRVVHFWDPDHHLVWICTIFLDIFKSQGTSIRNHALHRHNLLDGKVVEYVLLGAKPVMEQK